jgi:prevent-host-death family protein
MADTESARKEPERVSASDMHKRLAEVMDRAQFGGEHFIIERHKRDAVVVIGIEEYRRLGGAAAA